MLFALAAALLFIRLGLWQLDRLAQRRTHNDAIRQATVLPPLQIDSANLPALLAARDRGAHRRARVTGAWEPGGEVILRGRTRQGRPGVHIATPLRIAGTRTRIWVNRGWIAAPDGARPERRPVAEAGVVTVDGILQPLPPAGAGAPVGTGDLLTFRRLDPRALRARADGPVLPFYLQQLPTPGVAEPPYRVPPPELSEGSHLSYAVQWFSFAAIALIGIGILLVRDLRQPGG